MKNLIVLILAFTISNPLFSNSYKYFLTQKQNKTQVSFQFAKYGIKDLKTFHFFLKNEFGKDYVSNIKNMQFTLHKNIKYSDFLHCLYKSKIKYDNSDLDIAKRVLVPANVSATINPVKPSITANRRMVQNCIIEVDDTHILAENVNNCDDCSTDAIPLQFDYNFCGSFYDEVFINSNGNLSFETQYFVYNSIGIPNSSTAVIVAPFWADYDIRSCENQKITYKSEPNRLIVTYNEVGHYFNNCERTNTFQVVLTDGTDEYVGIGNNTAFYYGDMQWTTGDASEGENGFGGTPATVGLNKNDGMSYALIGRFNMDNDTYDGPEGEADGVNYLDNKCFTFKSEECNIDNCSISNLQVLLDINCEADADNIYTGNYAVEVFTSGGVGELSVYGDLSSLGTSIISNADVIDNTVNVFVEDSLGCVSSASVAAPVCDDCDFVDCGCTDADAFNYDDSANLDDDSCIYVDLSLELGPANPSTGTEYCTTITATNNDGSALSGIEINISSSENNVNSYNENFITDESGQIEFCYTSNSSGLDQSIVTAGSITQSFSTNWVNTTVECSNEPGVMQSSNSVVCGAGSFYTREAFSVVNSSSTKAYVIHENKNFDGTEYIAMQTSSRFYSPGTTHNNKPLYISAVIGKAGEDGFPMLDDACTVWTPYGAYVVFFNPVNINVMDENCSNGKYYVDVKVSGGVGGISPIRAYKSVSDGKTLYRNMSPNDILSFGPYPGSGSYNIQAFGAKGCNGALANDYLCSGLNRILNFSANSGIVKFAYFNEDITIKNVEVFNLKAQTIPVELSIDQHQCELQILNNATGLFVIKVLLSNKEVDYIKILR